MLKEYWNEGIPEGPYCYNFIEPADHGGYKIKPCPHFRGGLGVEGWCHLMDFEIMDMIKDCMINDYEVEG